MNYRHIYHAGSFADVFKHCVLITLVQSFFHKEKAMFYLDTHAGSAFYDLESGLAKKTNEADKGIRKIYSLLSDGLSQGPVDIINTYFSIVREFNTTPLVKSLIYPGSPEIVRQLIRPQDRMALVELHKEEYGLLKKQFYADKQVAVHCQDAYQALNALLPPLERRGLVLIDPAYEVVNENKLMISALKKVLVKWDTGVYAIWYPIKGNYENQLFLKKFKTAFSQFEILVTELTIFSLDIPTALNGCGMLIINPPWQIAGKIQSFLPWLWEILSVNHQGNYRVEWLNQVKQ